MIDLAAFGLHGMSWLELCRLALHFMILSLLSVGGAIAAAPDMQHYLVVEKGLLSDGQFAASIALAQAAPGPNVLFVALLGLEVAGLIGAAATMIGIMLPSSIVAIAFGRYRRRRAGSTILRAFTAGLAPLTLGLLLSTAWLLTAPTRGAWGGLALTAIATLTMLRTKVSPLWLIALGAVMGMLALV